MTTVVTSSLESRARASPRVVARRPRRAFDGRVPDKTNPSHSRAAGTSASSSRVRAVSDPREDVASAPELYTEDFLKFVSDKAEDSDDMEEREGLKSLVDMIRATLDMVEKMTKEAEEAQARIEAEVEAEAERAAAAGS